MKLSVATNFDNNFIDQITSYPVNEIYGKLSHDFIGGGRASYSTQGITKSVLKSHVKYAHKNGIKFNYLLNAACLGNREWTPKGFRSIRKLLDWLSNLNIEILTVSTPYLAEIVKKKYPHFILKIGIFANIDCPERARFWENLGADMLTLESFSINRNFPRLKAIRKSVKCQLQLIANFTCLSKCPMQIYHMNGLSHSSNSDDKTPYLDYCVLKCSYYSLKNPHLLIKSQWIRPEDIHNYEDLGYSNFKLLERNAPTDIMLKRVIAYSNRKSPRNLMELIQPYGFSQETKKEFCWWVKYFSSFFFEWPLKMQNLQKLVKKRGMLYSLKDNPLFLDSAKIPPDFIDKISKCSYTRLGDCSDCTYCHSIEKEAYKVNQEYKTECLDLYSKVFDQLIDR